MANKLMMLQDALPTERVGRYPKHTHQIRFAPFVAQPCMIAPVLPGETLNNIFTECRAVSDPIKNKLVGWKHHTYYFYCPISILGVENFKEMFVDPTNYDLILDYDVTAAVRETYTAINSIDWPKRCLDVIAPHYFWDEGATPRLTADGLPIVQLREQSWMDSITDDDDFETAFEGADISGATDAGDLDRLMDAFEMLRAMGLQNLSYEDWLRTNGIRVAEQQDGKPTLLAHFSEFQYPSNTITQGTGAVTSAVSWVVKGNEKKRMFFKEPGFVIGVKVVRPKVYFAGLAGHLAGFMTRAWDWMPNYLNAMPETSFKKFAADTGPLGDRTSAKAAYWVDMRDLLLYGDQFHNMQAFDPGLAGANMGSFNMLPLPPNDLSDNSWKYPTEAMLDDFFVTDGTEYIREDGYTSLGIVGHQLDYSAGSLAEL